MKSSYPCDYCYRTFARPGTLKRHTKKFCIFCPTSASYQSKKYPHVCVQCGICYKKKFLLDGHLRNDCGKIHQCYRCGSIFRYINSLRTHLKYVCRVPKIEQIEQLKQEY